MSNLQELIEFVEPYYRLNDKAHQIGHVLEVCNRAKDITHIVLRNPSEKTVNSIEAASILHDVGIHRSGRENHHIESRKFVNIHSNTILKIYNHNLDIKLVKNAVEEHRGSYKGEFSNIVSEIVSCADRHVPICNLSIFDRAYKTNFNITNDHEMSIVHALDHVKDKYGYGGYAVDRPLYVRIYGEQLELQKEFINGVTLEELFEYFDNKR